MIAGPDVTPGTSEALVELIDLHPTVIDLARMHHGAPVDGRSLMRLLDGSSDHHRDEHVAMLTNWSCLRTNEVKLVVSHDARSAVELYDLTNDPDERYNCAQEHPQRVNELRARLARRLHLDGTWQR